MTRGEQPPRASAARRHEPDTDDATRVAAAGTETTAQRTLAAAREHGIPLREDPDLIDTLTALDIGTEIPPELYTLIAEVLSWAYRTNAECVERRRVGSGRATVERWHGQASAREI